MLDVRNLSFEANKEQYIIHNISFQLSPGEILGILGPSGVGKTTILRALSGLIAPISGEVLVDNIDMKNMPVAERPISFLQQNFPLYHNLSVMDNVLVAFESIANSNRSENRKAADDMLLRIGIRKQFWDRKPKFLSGGEAQRVALAKALLKPCRILMLDEPFSNIDKNAKRNLNHFIREMTISNQIFCLFISHDETDLLFMVDRLIYMDNGTITQVGYPDAMLHSPASGKVAAIGSKIGLQWLSVGDLKKAGMIEEIPTSIPLECENIAWRADSSHLLLNGHSFDRKEQYQLNLPVTVKRIARIGHEVYYNILTKKPLPANPLWHMEFSKDVEHKDLEGLQSYLCINLKDILFLDGNDKILSRNDKS